MKDSFSQVCFSEKNDLISIFKSLVKAEVPCVLWQKPEDSGGREGFSLALIDKISFSSDTLFFKSLFTPFDFLSAPVIYVYIDKINLMFKFNVRQVNEDTMLAHFPQIIEKRISESEDSHFTLDASPEERNEITHSLIKSFIDQGGFGVNDFPERSEIENILTRVTGKSINLSDDTFLIKGSGEGNINDIVRVTSSKKNIRDVEVDDENKFKALRVAPRAAPKEYKVVTLRKSSNGQEKEYSLYDLSQGGMAFNSWSAGEFSQNDEIEVIKIGDQEVETKMVGIVRSILRVRDDSEELKVGVQFLTD